MKSFEFNNPCWATFLVSIFLGLLTNPASTAARNGILDMVAIDGMLVPNGSGGTEPLHLPYFFNDGNAWYPSSMNDLGQIAFQSAPKRQPGGGPPIASGSSIYRWEQGTTTLIASSAGEYSFGYYIQSPTQGPTSPDFAYYLPQEINNAGLIAIYAHTGGSPYVYDAGDPWSFVAAGPSAILRLDETAVTTVARQGEGIEIAGGPFAGFPESSILVNTGPGPNLPNFSTPAFNNAGQIAFKATLNDPYTKGIFVGDGSQLSTIAITGTPAPDTTGSFDSSPNFNFNLNTFASNPDIQLNDAGHVAFRSLLENTSDESEAEGLFVYGTTRRLVARTGQTAPGGGIFHYFPVDSFSLSNASRIAFGATVRDGVGNLSSGIFRSTANSVVQVVRAGQLAPSGTEHFSYVSEPQLKGANQILFRAGLATQEGVLTGGGLFLSSNGAIQEIARLGSTIQGDTAPLEGIKNAKLNESGQIAIYATLDAIQGIDAIYFYDPDLGYRVVAKSGDAFMGSTFTYLNFDSFNEAGQIAFSFGLADDRGGIARWTFQDVGVPGDFDLDGDVDGRDFLAWQRGESPNSFSASDLADWQANYGSVAISAVVAIPEVCSLSLALLGLISSVITRCGRSC